MAVNNKIIYLTNPVTCFNDFNDLKGYEKYKDIIDWWLSAEITNGGITWEKFEPDKSVKRHEMVLVMYRFYVLMFESTKYSEDAFTDVPVNKQFGTGPNPRYFDACLTLRDLGIINADDNDCFHPEENITLEDALVLFYRCLICKVAYVKAGTLIEEGTYDILAPYSDSNKVSGHAISAIATLIKSGIFVPQGEVLNPKGDFTRLEMIKLLYNARNTRSPIFMRHTEESRILAGKYVDGGLEIIKNEFLYETKLDTSAIYAKNGASVEIADSVIMTVGGLNPNYNILTYRWGVNNTVLSNGEGSIVRLSNTEISTSSSALFAVCGGTIYATDCKLTTTGPAAVGAAYNGNIFIRRAKMNTAFRAVGSLFFGGKIVCTEVDVYNRGSLYLLFSDESTDMQFYDSNLVSESELGHVTGVANLTLSNTNVKSKGGLILENNCSLLTDICTVNITGGSFKVSDDNIINTIKKQRSIIKVAGGAKFYIAEGYSFLIAKDESAVKFFGADLDFEGNMTADETSSLDIYLTNSNYKGASANATISLDKKSKWVVTGDSVLRGLNVSDVSNITSNGKYTIKYNPNRSNISAPYKLSGGGRLVPIQQQG